MASLPMPMSHFFAVELAAPSGSGAATSAVVAIRSNAPTIAECRVSVRLDIDPPWPMVRVRGGG